MATNLWILSFNCDRKRPFSEPVKLDKPIEGIICHIKAGGRGISVVASVAGAPETDSIQLDGLPYEESLYGYAILSEQYGAEILVFPNRHIELAKVLDVKYIESKQP